MIKISKAKEILAMLNSPDMENFVLGTAMLDAYNDSNLILVCFVNCDKSTDQWIKHSTVTSKLQINDFLAKTGSLSTLFTHLLAANNIKEIHWELFMHAYEKFLNRMLKQSKTPTNIAISITTNPIT